MDWSRPGRLLLTRPRLFTASMLLHSMLRQLPLGSNSCSPEACEPALAWRAREQLVCAGAFLRRPRWTQGFARVEADLADIDLDSPHASSLFQRYKAQALQEAWLSA